MSRRRRSTGCLCVGTLARLTAHRRSPASSLRWLSACGARAPRPRPAPRSASAAGPPRCAPARFTPAPSRSCRRAACARAPRVAVSLGNALPFAALTYALFKLGAVLVPLNPSFGPAQVRAALAALAAQVLVVGAVTDLAYRPGVGRCNRAEHLGARVACEAVPSLRTVVVDNRAEYRGGPDAYFNNGELVARSMGLCAADRIVVPPPLFHCFGPVLGFMATATTGAALLLPSPAFDPAATLRMCVDAGATGLYGVTTMLVAGRAPAQGHRGGQQRARGADGPRARAPGAGRPSHLLRHDGDEPCELHDEPGRPAVKIVAPGDRTRIQPVGARGEFAAAGYHVMQGYWSDAAQTAEVRVAEPDAAAPGGATVWMYSGDEAVMDAVGYVTITGRIKDLIIRAGENIHPLEVENCLFQHPAVREDSVIGVPDDRLGEAVAAFVLRRRDKGPRCLPLPSPRTRSAPGSTPAFSATSSPSTSSGSTSSPRRPAARSNSTGCASWPSTPSSGPNETYVDAHPILRYPHLTLSQSHAHSSPSGPLLYSFINRFNPQIIRVSCPSQWIRIPRRPSRALCASAPQNAAPTQREGCLKMPVPRPHARHRRERDTEKWEKRTGTAARVRARRCNPS